MIQNRNLRSSIKLYPSQNGFIYSSAISRVLYCVRILSIGDSQRVCHSHHWKHPLGWTIMNEVLRLLPGCSLGPLLDLQHVIPDAVSEGIRDYSRVLRGEGVMTKQLNTNCTTMRTLGTTTRSRIDVIRATTHSRVCSCSLTCSGTCRK